MTNPDVPSKVIRSRGILTGSLFAIFMLGMGLRVYGLDSSSLWLDEITTAATAQLDVGSILQFHLEEAGNPPLLSLITHASFACWGQNEFAARLASALFGSLSILLAYKVGETLWTREVGIAAAFLLAVNAYHIQYSQEARHYALMVFLALLSLIFLLKALQGNKKGLWIGFAFCTALSLYNHYFAFLFLPAEVLFGAWVIAEKWLSHRRRGNHAAEAHPSVLLSSPARQALMLSLSLLLVGMAYLPWISALRAQFPKQLESPTLGVSMASLQLSLDFLREVLVAYSGAVLLLWLGLFLWGLVTCGRKQKALVILWIGAPFAFLSIVEPSHPVHPRYVIFSLPLYLLVIARGLMSLSRLLNRALDRIRGAGQWSLAVTQVLTVLILATLNVPAIRDYYLSEKEDWRGATAYLLENMSGNDLIIADGQTYGGGGDAHRTFKGLTYHFSVSGEDATIFEAQRGLADMLKEVEDSGASAWGILWHTKSLSYLEQVSGDIEVVEFARVAVVRLVDPRGDVLEDTVSVLEALAMIQPRPVGRFDLHLALAEVYVQMGSLAEAASQAELASQVAADFEKAMQLAPRRANPSWTWEPYWDLGHTYEHVGSLEEAIAAYEEVLRIDPSNWRAHLRLGNIYRAQNEPAQALAAYQRALDMEQGNARLHFLLGETYQGLGKTDEAITAYREVLRIYPAHAEAGRRVQMLSLPIDEGIQYPLWRSLGLEVALLGYDLDSRSVSAGEISDIVLWWQALNHMNRDYTVFLHLVGPDGRIWAQQDTLLESDGRTTSTWQPGETARVEYQLELSLDIPPGEYTIQTGAYYWETGERLLVWDDNGQRVPDDTIVLQIVSLAPCDRASTAVAASGSQ